MKMSDVDAGDIQWNMLVITIDDTPNCPLLISGGGGRTKESDAGDWIRSVNLIYRCLHCDLWTADPYELFWFSKEGLTNYSFCKILSKSNPFDLDLEDTIQYWIGAQLFNTDYGKSFVESFGVENLKDDVYPPFIEALEDIFREKGVPWEAGDLFDIKVNLLQSQK